MFIFVRSSFVESVLLCKEMFLNFTCVDCYYTDVIETQRKSYVLESSDKNGEKINNNTNFDISYVMLPLNMLKAF